MEPGIAASTLLVSVIIPCFNHGKYLPAAINSVKAQSCQDLEIIVVDDGSSDNTREVCNSFTGVQYVYQQNQGLSAARNTGIDHAKGNYFVFLDADDWLAEDALKINRAYLLNDPGLAFVSGAHFKYIEPEGRLEEKKVTVNEPAYQRFLKGNFIAMHATVMYRRWAFENIRFDVGLRSLEDYDVYLKLSRNHKTFHHQQIIAYYRIHNENMSGNIPVMLESALLVLKRQEPLLGNSEEKKAFHEGIDYWTSYYTGAIYIALLKSSWAFIKSRKKELAMLKQNNLLLYLKLILKKRLHVG